MVSDTLSTNCDADFDTSTDSIEEWYADLDNAYQISEHTADLDYLCDATENHDTPIHSWFNLKEAFSSEFPNWVINYLAKKYDYQPSSVLDPFCGGGTTGIALSKQGVRVVSVEYNPFIAWAAKTKSMWWAYDVDEIRAVIANVYDDIGTPNDVDWPELTTFENQDYFRPSDIEILLQALKSIASLHCSDFAKNFLRLGLAASIEEVANLRKDGRALRYVEKIPRPYATEALLTHWTRNLLHIEKMIEDGYLRTFLKPQVWMGNAMDLRNLTDPWNKESHTCILDSSLELVLYSPPYLNNFDYSEIYKLELWLLGFIENYEQWKELRRGTLRSHHSIKFNRSLHIDQDYETKDVYNKLREMGESDALKGYAKKNMPSVILGYFDDMYMALKEQYRVLKPGGFIAYLVANSRHSDLPVATDIVIGEIAERVGFEKKEMLILQKRNGRTRKKKFLRESVVILRKPIIARKT